MNQLWSDIDTYGLGFLQAGWTVLLITVATIILSWIVGFL